MNILILTEGSSLKGFGHISRSIALAQAFQKGVPGAKVKFIVDADERAVEFLRSAVIDDIIYGRWNSKPKAPADQVRWADRVIIDSYAADKALYDDISNITGGRVLMLDDYRRIEYPKGIVLNPSIFAGRLKYPSANGVRYLLGKDYVMLRKEFWDAPDKDIADDVKKALITFGGLNNGPLIERISRSIRSDFHFVLIDTGIRTFSSKEMFEAIMEADICISGGGQTLNELAQIGIPTISVCLAENQRLNLEGFEESGFIEYAGRGSDRDLLDKIGMAIKRLLPREERLRRKKIGRSLLGTKRTDRLCRAVMELEDEKN